MNQTNFPLWVIEKLQNSYEFLVLESCQTSDFETFLRVITYTTSMCVYVFGWPFSVKLFLTITQSLPLEFPKVSVDFWGS